MLLSKAKAFALDNSTCRIPMVSVILRGNKQIAWGANKKGFRGTSLHSEIDALRLLRYRKRRAKGRQFVQANHGGRRPLRQCLCKRCLQL